MKYVTEKRIRFDLHNILIEDISDYIKNVYEINKPKIKIISKGIIYIINTYLNFLQLMCI